MADLFFPVSTAVTAYSMSGSVSRQAASVYQPFDTIFRETTSANSVFDTTETLDAFEGGTLKGSATFAGTVTHLGEEYPAFNMPNGQLLVDGVALPEPDYPDIDSLNLDTSDDPFCFLAGTAISTPDGEVAVETLSIGTPTLTFDGRVVPLQWIGHQTVHKLFSGPNVQPVRIRAGALGEGLPRADLTVTADHGMILDGHVINASALVNGQSINWVPPSDLPGRFTPSTMSRPRNMT